MRKILALILCVSCPAVAGAADFSADARGTTGAQFLELPVGARAIAMGSAYSSISGDPFSAYYNPAGLARINQFNVGLMHAMYFQDISYEYGVMATPIGKLGVLGVSAQYLAVNKLAELDKNGTPTGDSIKPNDMALSVTYAKRLGMVDFGVSAKQIKSQILNSASSFAGDIGLQFRAGDFGFGMSVMNVGKGLKFLDEESSLPTTGRAGISFKVTPRWFMSIDGIAPKGTNPIVAAGTEYKLISNRKMDLALRAGYNSRYATSKLGDSAGISAGAGLDFGGVSVDYAWSIYGDLGVTHRFSLSLKLGEGVKPEQSAQRTDIPQQPAPVLMRDGQKTYQDCLESADEYISQKDYENAALAYADALKTLTENDKRRIYTFEQQGKVAVKLDNIPQARAYYFAAIQAAKNLNMPETMVINSFLGLAYCSEKNGEIGLAIRNYENALKLSTNEANNTKIRKILEQLKMEDSLAVTD